LPKVKLTKKKLYGAGLFDDFVLTTFDTLVGQTPSA